MVRADEAKAIGLADEVYAPEELMNAALEMAKSFTKNAPIAVKYAKACIDRGVQMDIDDGIAVENELFAMCFGTADQKEGMTAFPGEAPRRVCQQVRPVAEIFPETMIGRGLQHL
jgi:enoyl-CoA hydratase